MGLFGRRKPSQIDQRLADAGVTPLGGKSEVMRELIGWGSVHKDAAGRSARLAEHGVQAPATVNSFAVGPPTPMFGGIPVDLDLTVEPPGGEPYELEIHQVFRDADAKTLARGQRVTVRVDPDDPRSAMVWLA